MQVIGNRYEECEWSLRPWWKKTHLKTGQH